MKTSVTAGRKARQDALDIIRQERDALAALADTLPDEIEDAIDCILNTSGHLVIAGIGKSGHVGRKLAATFSATGTPSFFVHAAEAGHGDLGMIKADDTILILSNSGASPELRSILDHAHALGVAVIGIAGRLDSPLMRECKIPLLLPDVPEACPEGIAPTTSTTMMIAMGDALAIAVMKARGVSRNLLVLLHPGGAIGFGNLPVASLLRDAGPPPLVRKSSSMRDVVLEISSGRKGLAGVTDDEGNLLGVISDGDVRRSLDRFLIARADEIMTSDPKTVSADTKISDALRLMLANEITAIFVMKDGETRRPLGVLNIHDLGRPA
ncbi:KpsF/GutQ family sugar-phosphate isomerase [Croceicoccus gelatinilyticus]|uniref:KpsF/GutQ family sugar-phosphate isomerase n=1 Tax=Croceicoccus gelatinilyticus TaxID=2835536 RepID=UPI001BD0DEA1|nr:KpsF/GutQ family sugar-phosphate isomerase [Croceicoccus gelatinilyticus]MBS7671200.1 KpsF/GutQ family sugar-phosphate isomerase [Croceicoccus gelatinilyticus]